MGLVSLCHDYVILNIASGLQSCHVSGYAWILIFVIVNQVVPLNIVQICFLHVSYYTIIVIKLLYIMLLWAGFAAIVFLCHVCRLYNFCTTRAVSMYDTGMPFLSDHWIKTGLWRLILKLSQNCCKRKRLVNTIVY